MYGKQTFSLAQDIGVSVGEAEEIVAKYLKSKPRVSEFINNTQDFLSANGYVDTLQGHRRILMGAFGDKKAHSDAMRQSVNTIIQGSGAYLTNTSCILIDKLLRNYQSNLIATVHDSVLIDMHPDEIKELVPKVKYIMENLPIPFLKFTWKGQENVQFPIDSEVEIGSTYHDIHEYDEEEFFAFDSVKGFTQYHNALRYISDSYESKNITEAEYNYGIQYVKNNREKYLHIQ